MKRTLTINGRSRALELSGDDKITGSFDGIPFAADAAELSSGVYSLLIDGRSFDIRISNNQASEGYIVDVDGVSLEVAIDDPRAWLGRKKSGGEKSRGESSLAVSGKQQITAPMAGKVVRVLVEEGQQVAAGAGLVVVEAMKMQNEIRSRKAGAVSKIAVRAGQAVNSGDTLLIVE